MIKSGCDCVLMWVVTFKRENIGTNTGHTSKSCHPQKKTSDQRATVMLVFSLSFSYCGDARRKLQWCAVPLPFPLQWAQLHRLHLWWAPRWHEMVWYHAWIWHRPAFWILPHGWWEPTYCFVYSITCFIIYLFLLLLCTASHGAEQQGPSQKCSSANKHVFGRDRITLNALSASHIVARCSGHL